MAEIEQLAIAISEVKVAKAVGKKRRRDEKGINQAAK